MRLIPFGLLLAAAAMAAAQSAPTAPAVWRLLDSGTTASLRGIDAVDGTVAWASGTGGTVLRTTDGGAHWLTCTVPDAATDGATLDFRGVRAWDAQTAIVMSSGPGKLSRLYKTTDGCSNWIRLFTNPEREGFYDALLFIDPQHGIVLGDPVHGDPQVNPVEGGYFTFRIRVTPDAGKTWVPVTDPEFGPPGKNLQPLSGEAFFAASNRSMAARDGWLWIGTGKNRVLRRKIAAPEFQSSLCAGAIDPFSQSCGIPWLDWQSAVVPLASGNASSGIFAVAFRDDRHGMAVGGDYGKPGESAGTAAWSADGGQYWTVAAEPPHGYRSSVEWSGSREAWIAAGTNGSDISRDDGKTWQRLDGGNWNALSLPFVVGPKGRIGRLDPAVLPDSAKNQSARSGEERP